jgi:hypothetical protein
MSEPDTNEFLQRISNIIYLYCKEHAGSKDTESVEAMKTVFTIMEEITEALKESYPQELAQSHYVRATPRIIRETLELKRPTPRMIHDTLKAIVVSLYVGSRKMTEEDFEESEFARRLPRMMNFVELKNAAEILHDEASQGVIKLEYV